MKKGFTLIELLAVIVILAIIALIATPIVLSIINDTKESATLRSADFYLDGVELAVSQSILKDISIPDGQYPIMKDGNICVGDIDNNDACTGDVLEVEVKGEKPNNGVIEIESGQISDILLYSGNNKVVKNEDGELTSVTQVYKPQYYYWEDNYDGTIGSVLPVGAKENASEVVAASGHPVYLGFDVELNGNDEKIIIEAYSCLTKDGTEYCVKKNDNKISKAIAIDAFKSDGGSCSFDDVWDYCRSDGLSIYAYSGGMVRVYEEGSYFTCDVYDDGFSSYVK